VSFANGLRDRRLLGRNPPKRLYRSFGIKTIAAPAVSEAAITPILEKIERGHAAMI
jgi:hypothetical protein